MSRDPQRTAKGWGHRLREENRGLKEKVAGLRKELGHLQKRLQNTWKLLDHIPGGLMLIQQQKILFANQTACRESGYTREEMLTKDVSDLLGPDSASFIASLQPIKSVDPFLSNHHDTFLTTKEGQTLAAEVRGHKIRHKGRTAFLVHIISLEQRNEEEKQIRQSLKTEAFVRMASGFRRELEALTSSFEKDIHRIQGPDTHEGSTRRSFGATETLREKKARLSKDLHCLIRAPYEPSEIAPLDLKHLIQTAVEISNPEMVSGPELTSDNVTFNTFLRAASPVYGCEKELQDVFAHIILNAAEALPDGGDIYLTTEEHAGYAHIYVQDNGVGIPEEIMGKIFDPFFTTKDGNRRGLGLSLSHAIIARHQGEIRVMSQEGRGSTFVVKLPLIRKATLIKAKAPKKGIKDSQILMIGKDGVLTAILVSLLLNKGGHITTAASYTEVLKLIRDTRFDLIIADQNVSETNRTGIIHRIKELRPDLPVALIDTRGTTGSRRIQGKTGADLTMGRPLDVDRLLSLVSRLLAKGVSPQ
ncbi:MAG: PAS domain S-box protein [Deltaproteobacteria bacterium]|nr:PAS domain S-box protein [Deltaproteobacteria bacterium]